MFKNIYNVLSREIEIISKDRNIFIILIIAPLFYAFVYGSLYINKTEEKVPICVVDMDRTEFSNLFIKRLGAHQLINVINVTGDLNEAKTEMNRMNVHAIIYIASESEKLLESKRSITISALLNTTRFLVSNDVNKAVNEVAFSFSDENRKLYLQTIGYNSREAETLIEPVKTDIRPMFNNTETYGDYLIPGLLALILHQTLFIGLSECFARERQFGLLKELKTTSGNNSFNVITGKSIFYFILYFAYSLFFFTINYSFLNIKLEGSFVLLLIITSIMILSAIFLTFIVSSFFKRKFIALVIIAFTTYPIFFITGYVFPSYALPEPIQYLSQTLALTPYLKAYIRVTQLGVGFENIKNEVIHLSIITISLFVLAFARIKYLLHKTN